MVSQVYNDKGGSPPLRYRTYVNFIDVQTGEVSRSMDMVKFIVIRSEVRYERDGDVLNKFIDKYYGINPQTSLF